MAIAIEPFPDDAFRTVDERRKRLGQYFTGVKIARLLAALADTRHADSVIDPMVGSGDMLVGSLAHGTPAMIGGVEIDPLAYAQCAARLEASGVRTSGLQLGSAFSPAVLTQLPTLASDIVITNPPYVRYQSTSRTHGTGMRIPSGTETRRDLIEAIDLMQALDDRDKRMFKELARGYSGLADLAVPAWILCAGLVKVGGTLAMLVPTTWLSRNYAHPIRYLLQRWFSVSYVVEDDDASWFSDALVRTSLVVARRVARRDSAFTPAPETGHVHLRITTRSADERSCVGRLFPKADDPDTALADLLARWRASSKVPAKNSLASKWVPASHDAAALRSAAAGERWLTLVEDEVDAPVGGAAVPSALVPLTAHCQASFVSLEQLGWRAGQGLRTGANKFFYLRKVESLTGAERLLPSAELGRLAVSVPTDASVPVLQRQSDLPQGYAVQAEELEGRVLVLDAYALPEDLTSGSRAPYTPLADGLAEHVRHAAVINVGTEDEPKLIPQLSAVITNVRAAAEDRAARFWYQLPRFTDRHQPALLLARVNNSHPRTLINPGRRAIVDANFVTLWPTQRAVVDADALLAVLNSAWCAAVLELVGTVLGGGALKVEAAHMRRIPIPQLSPASWQAMSRLGQELTSGAANSTETLHAINALLFEGIGLNIPTTRSSESRLSLRSVCGHVRSGPCPRPSPKPSSVMLSRSVTRGANNVR